MKESMRSSLLWIWFAVFLILQGCVHATVQPNQISKAHTTELKQRYYQVKTKASDGTLIAFTVYQPKLSTNQTAPLILHTHGFGLSRMKRPELSLYGFYFQLDKSLNQLGKRLLGHQF
jgi:hypothetical protein